MTVTMRAESLAMTEDGFDDTVTQEHEEAQVVLGNVALQLSASAGTSTSKDK